MALKGVVVSGLITHSLRQREFLQLHCFLEADPPPPPPPPLGAPPDLGGPVGVGLRLLQSIENRSYLIGSVPSQGMWIVLRPVSFSCAICSKLYIARGSP